MYKFLTRLIVAAALILPVYPIPASAQENSTWTNPLKECWSFSSDQVSQITGASDNESVVIIPFDNNVLIALDISNGKPIWRRSFENEFTSNIMVSGNTLFIALKSEETKELPIKLALDKTKPTYSEITSIDIDSGLNNWTKPLDSTRNADDTTYINQNASVIFTASKNGEITAIGKSERETLWRINLGTSLSGYPVIDDTNIFIPTINKTIIVLSTLNGEIIKQIPAGIIPSAIAYSEEHILIGDTNGNVNNVAVLSGKLNWRARTGGAIRQIHSIEGNTLVISDDNFAYLLEDNSGNKLWKRKLSGRIMGSSFSAPQIGVFLSSGSNEAIVIDLNGGKIVNRIPAKESSYFVSSPIVIGNRVVLPTNTGLYAYGSDCDEKFKFESGSKDKSLK